jgi:hypothetical protein
MIPDHLPEEWPEASHFITIAFNPESGTPTVTVDPVISWEGAEAVFIPPEAGDEDES